MRLREKCLDERTNHTLKTAMGKSLDGFQEWWEGNLKFILFAQNSSVQASRELTLSPAVWTGAAAVWTGAAAVWTGAAAVWTGAAAVWTGAAAVWTGAAAVWTGAAAVWTGAAAVWTGAAAITETPPDVEVVETDQKALEDHLQARTEKDVEVFDQVTLNMDKAQEKQKESYRRKIKEGTKSLDIRANDLVWKKDERKARPGKPCCSFAPCWVRCLLRDHPLPPSSTPLT
ncbi:uncharacterized protein LOC115191766 [Salmo trutta]|uniref:uncharacterized protein LOC115191766 n=1 Tax=Salmo trutta TaxID=8032 RepID=UPI0011327C6F|nr:uncharacterized protein LOC115191766 [Salmo trutta]